jgi:hypothetical protein
MKILDNNSGSVDCHMFISLMKSVAALLAGLALFMPVTMSLAATVEYDLTIARQEVNFTGQSAQAMTINGQLPGPTLRFTEGDHAVIRVHNQMDVETSIHWHGILLPNAMDGVPFVTFPPIAPGRDVHVRVRSAAIRHLLVSQPHHAAGTAGHVWRAGHRAEGGDCIRPAPRSCRGVVRLDGRGCEFGAAHAQTRQ